MQLARLCNVGRVDYRLLMLGGRRGRGGLPAWVAGWLGTAKARRPEVERRERMGTVTWDSYA